MKNKKLNLVLYLMAFASLHLWADGTKIDLSGKWQFSQGDSPTYGDEVVLPGSMFTNGKGEDVCPHTKWTAR